MTKKQTPLTWLAGDNKPDATGFTSIDPHRWEEMKRELEREQLPKQDSFYACCCYCSLNENETKLRVYQTDPWGRIDSWICEECFTPQDTGPCWDDLEEI